MKMKNTKETVLRFAKAIKKLREDKLKKESHIQANYKGEFYAEQMADLNAWYEQNRQSHRAELFEGAGRSLEELNVALKEKVATSVSEDALRDAQLLQMREKVTGEEIELIANKYRGAGSFILMGVLKEIAAKNGYMLHASTVNDISDILGEAHERIKKLGNTYEGEMNDYMNELLITEHEGNFFDVASEQLEEAFSPSEVIVEEMR